MGNKSSSGKSDVAVIRDISDRAALHCIMSLYYNLILAIYC